MQVVAFINSERVASRILAYLGLPTMPPSVRSSRDPPQTQFVWENGGADAEPDYAWGDPIPNDLN